MRTQRRPLPLVIAIAGFAALAVAVFVVVVPGLLTGPDPTTSPPPSASESPSGDAATPEGATRAFFEAYAEARRTGSPEAVLAFVTSENSSAYLTVHGFVRGQTDAGKASVTTVLELANLRTAIDGDVATVVLDFTEGGYDIDLDSGEPLESPVVLPTRRLTVELHRSGGVWLVESFEAQL